MSEKLFDRKKIKQKLKSVFPQHSYHIYVSTEQTCLYLVICYSSHLKNEGFIYFFICSEFCQKKEKKEWAV